MPYPLSCDAASSRQRLEHSRSSWPGSRLRTASWCLPAFGFAGSAGGGCDRHPSPCSSRHTCADAQKHPGNQHPSSNSTNVLLSTLDTRIIVIMSLMGALPFGVSRGQTGNNNFDFQTSKQIFGPRRCTKQYYYQSLAEQQPRVFYQMLNFCNDFSLIV